MLHRAVRPLLRVALLSVLLGFIPPAAPPIAHAAAPQHAATPTVESPVSVTPHAVAHIALASQPAPEPDITPRSRTAQAPIGQLAQPNGESQLTLLPFHSTGYRYSVALPDAGAGFEQPSFNDSGFATGAAGFGTTPGACAVNNPTDVKTPWAINSDILVRKSFTLPPGAHNLQVQVMVDNGVQVFVNGHDISGMQIRGGCPVTTAPFDFTFTASDTYLVAGTNLLAVRGRDTGNVAFLDMQVTASGTALDLRANRTGGEVGPCACNQTANPVNTRSGNFWTSVTDLSITTPGPDLTWSRIYASQAITDTTSVLGYSWQSPYTARLLLPSSGPDAGRAIIVSGRANQIRFTLQNGQYVRDLGVTSTLTSTLVGASTIYTQTLRDQQQLVFDGGTGRLKTIRDTQGRNVILNYTGSPSRLTSIADAADSSRALTLGYDGSGHINSVSDGAGRSVTYSYSDGNDNLTGVIDVMLHTTAYTYATPANHLLTKIERTRNGSPELIEKITYDTASPARVNNQVLQDGRTIQFQYYPDKTVMTTTRPNGQSEVQEDVYTSANTLAGIRINSQAVQAGGFDANFNPKAVGDGEGHTTQTNFNLVGLPITQTNALGQTAKVQYDGLNHPLYVTDTLGIATAYQYDQYNNVTRVTAGITTTSSLRATTYYTYSYNIRYAGDSLLSKMKRPDGIIVRYNYPTSGSITAKGQLQSMTVGDGLGTLAQTTTYEYDQPGRVVTTTVGFGTNLARKDITNYNADNTVASTIQNYKDKIFTTSKPDEDIITTYGYDEYGRQIWVKDVLGHYDVTYYNANGQVGWTTHNLGSYSGGVLPATAPDYSPSAPDANITTKYGYDDLGRTTLITQTGILTGTFNPGTLQFSTAISRVTKTEYDALSRPVTMTLDLGGINARSLTYYDGASSPIWQRDPYGRWAKTDYDALSRPITTTVNYKNGSVAANEPSDQDLITTMHYDIAGRVDRQIDNWVDGSFGSTDTITDRLTLYQYDTLGRQTTTTQNATTRTGMDLNRITQTLFDPAKGWALGQKTYQLPAPANSVTRWSSQQYDVLGRTITSIQNCTKAGVPQNPLISACDAFSNSFTDRNVPTLTAYDTLNRLTDATMTINATTSVVNHTQFDGLGRAQNNPELC